jgi:hypothetical protein
MWRDGTLDLSQETRGRVPALDDPDDLRDAVIGTWHGRMVNEWMSSYVFGGLAAQLADLGDVEAAARCYEFAREEQEHGRLCGAVVVAARGEARAAVPPPRPLPVHAKASRRAAAARNVLSIACLSETVAVALIGAERLEMSEGPLRELLTRIWADEVGHARFGWTWLERALPALDDDELAAVNAYLPYALGHLEAHELSHLPIACEPPIEGREYGVCSGRAARALFYDTVREVIVPSLEARGLSGARAWEERKVA